MLHLHEDWIWDSWPVEDGDDHHLFFLKAPRHLNDPQLRHLNPTIGHAVSRDYENWTFLPDALIPGPSPSWDDYTVWTGSVVRGDTGQWHLFYTGGSRAENGLVQRIGRADSDDLIAWRRRGAPLVQADPRWYETTQNRDWFDEAWRDPWVFKDADGDGWHMLITARCPAGPRLSRGVLGHARSHDLLEWEVQPPLTDPAGFGQLEVSQVTQVEGRWILTFCCMPPDMSANRRTGPALGDMWSVPAAGPLGPFQMDRAENFAHDSLYAAHLVNTRAHGWAFVGFDNIAAGKFVGAIPHPVPVQLTPAGTVQPRRTQERSPEQNSHSTRHLQAQPPTRR